MTFSAGIFQKGRRGNQRIELAVRDKEKECIYIFVECMGYLNVEISLFIFKSSFRRTTIHIASPQ